MSTIGLVMICKDEAHCIEKSLNSVKGIIDSWRIVDTGSEDETPQIVKKVLKGISGRLIKRPWKNMGYNRTESLHLARGAADYSLIVDADDEFTVTDEFDKSNLDKDYYMINLASGQLMFPQVRVLNNKLDWRYEGVLHAYPVAPESSTYGVLPGISILSHHTGASWKDPNKYRRGAYLLEQTLLDEPLNARYVFYAAQSYRDCADYQRAIELYKKRSEMTNGFFCEIWYSIYMVGYCYLKLGDVPHAIEWYEKAIENNPHRAEPFVGLCQIYRQLSMPNLAYLYVKLALGVPASSPFDLFVDSSCYPPNVYDIALLCSNDVGNVEEAVKYGEYLVKTFPNDVRMTNNLSLIRQRLNPPTAKDNVVEYLVGELSIVSSS